MTDDRARKAIYIVHIDAIMCSLSCKMTAPATSRDVHP